MASPSNPPRFHWTAKIFQVVSTATIDTLADGVGCSYGRHEMAEEAIMEAAFRFLEPTATDWGFVDEPGLWSATLPDGTLREHTVEIRVKEEPERSRFTADVVLDGKEYRAVAR